MEEIEHRVMSHISEEENIRILMFGLDGSGKTSILNKLKLDEDVTTNLNIGINVETVECKKMLFTVWDISCNPETRFLCRHYIRNESAVIFVVDSSDRERIGEAAKEFHSLMKKDELQNAIVLVLANKKDLTDTMSTAEIGNELKLHSLKQTWHLQATSATEGLGVYEGLDYLFYSFAKMKK